MSKVKTIPTVYREIEFKSHLEAQWAVFYDTLGIEWEYTLKTFSLDSGGYTPDFYFPSLKSYMKVLPNISILERINQASLELADFLNPDFDDYIDRPTEDFKVYVMYGDITIPTLVKNKHPLNMECELYSKGGHREGLYFWAEHIETAQIEIVHRSQLSRYPYVIRSYSCDTVRLCKAYFVARTVDFERLKGQVPEVSAANSWSYSD
jgi:hypothetical protein